MKLTPFRLLRIGLLLVMLAFVAFYTKNQRLSSRSWLEPLEVVVYPINADGSAAVEEYINSITERDFAAIDRFMKRESEHYDIVSQEPTRTIVGPVLDTLPPEAPSPDASLPSIIWWSMKLRIWAFRNTPDNAAQGDQVRMFTLYYQASDGKRLKHSFGLSKGLIGVAHVFAASNQQAQNNIVIAHELLHTVGATDKYGTDGEPVYPNGYAEPDISEVYPQQFAEIMAGRIPFSKSQSRMANSLRDCVVGDETATEINWFVPG